MRENHQTINRVYLMLDIPEKPCIVDYKWSSTRMEWILEKVVWNDFNSTLLKPALEVGKYYIGVF